MSLLLDLRHGLRRLRNSPGFTALATACLGIGIGASIGVFSILQILLLRPLPEARAPRELVTLTPKPGPMPGMPEMTFLKPLSYPAFLQYRAMSRTFSEIVAYTKIPVSLAVPGEGHPLRVSGHVATANYFSALGLHSALGRTLAEGRGAAEPRSGVVISDELWRRVFHRRHDVLGRTLLLNGRTFQVAGVLPEGFRGVERTDPVDVWLSLEAAPLVVPDMKETDLADPEHFWLDTFFARLAPGMSVEKAQAEVDVIARVLAKESPRGAFSLEVSPGVGIHPLLRKSVLDPLLLLTAAVAALLLLVCANLAGLLLTQAAAREREIGIRIAFGATPERIVQQLLSESMLLGLLGGFAGVAFGRALMTLLEDVALGQLLPYLMGLTLDRRVAAFALGLALATGLLFGLAPALWASQARWLREGSGNTPSRSRLTEAFVVGQIALSLMLLAGTGLFVRTWRSLQEIPPGLDGRGVADFQLDLTLQRYGDRQGQAFYDQLLERVRRLPGVRSASLALGVPLDRGQEAQFFGNIGPEGSAAGPRAVTMNLVSSGYFKTLGIPLRGRDFSLQDRDGAAPVVIVSESLARELWPGRDPVGQRATLDRKTVEVVGVAGDVRTDLKSRPQDFVYRPVQQLYFPNLTLQVKTAAGTAGAVVAPVRAEIARLDRNLPISRVSLLEEEIRHASAQPLLFSELLGGASGVAMLLTGIGLYGTLAFSVRRRTREMGVRRALGARTSEILELVLKRGLTLTGLGLACGTAASLLATRVVSGLLFGVKPTDPAVFLTGILICGALGTAASLLPAWSATRVDPMEALRQE
jgi:predicted permease